MARHDSFLKAAELLLIIGLILGSRALPFGLLVALLISVWFAPLLWEYAFHRPDERQQAIAHNSSHWAFYVMLGLIILVIVREYLRSGQNPPPLWYLLVILPLLVKLGISLFQNYEPLRVARYLGIGWGLLWSLFVVLSHGVRGLWSPEVLPFAASIFLIVVLWRHPRMLGVFLLLFALGLIVFFHAWNRLDFYLQLLMLALVPLPVLVCGIILIRYPASGEKGESHA